MAYFLRFDGGDNYVEFDSPLNINNSTVYIKFKSGIQDRRRFILGTGNSAFYIRINNGLLEYGIFGRSGNLPTPVQENTEYTLRISHEGVSFDISEPLLGSASDTGTNETEFRFIGRWFTGSDRFNGDIFYIKKYDFTEENLLANYEKQTLNGTNDTTLPDTVGGNNGALVNFPTDDSQWIQYASAAPSADVNFTLSTPVFAASADATLPQPRASIAYNINAPTFTVDATVTLPNPTADVSYEVNAPTFSVSGEVTIPQPTANASFSLHVPTIAASATATEPSFNANVAFTVNAPSVSISASATLPQPESAVSFTVSPPSVSVVAIVGGIAIIVDSETNINQRAMSTNINAPILSNNING